MLTVRVTGAELVFAAGVELDVPAFLTGVAAFALVPDAEPPVRDDEGVLFAPGVEIVLTVRVTEGEPVFAAGVEPDVPAFLTGVAAFALVPDAVPSLRGDEEVLLVPGVVPSARDDEELPFVRGFTFATGCVFPVRDVVFPVED